MRITRADTYADGGSVQIACLLSRKAATDTPYDCLSVFVVMNRGGVWPFITRAISCLETSVNASMDTH